MEYKANEGVTFTHTNTTLNGCTIKFSVTDPAIEDVEVSGIAEPFEGQQGFIADEIREMPKFDVYRLNPVEAKILAQYGWIVPVTPERS